MLQGLKREQRQKLIDAIEEVSFHSGEVIVAEGRAGYSLIERPRDALQGGEGDLGTRKAFFGERSLIERPLATATAAAACSLAHRARRIRPHAGQGGARAVVTRRRQNGARCRQVDVDAAGVGAARRGAPAAEVINAPVVEADTFERAERVEHAPLHRWPAHRHRRLRQGALLLPHAIGHAVRAQGPRQEHDLQDGRGAGGSEIDADGRHPRSSLTSAAADALPRHHHPRVPRRPVRPAQEAEAARARRGQGGALPAHARTRARALTASSTATSSPRT